MKDIFKCLLITGIISTVFVVLVFLVKLGYFLSLLYPAILVICLWFGRVNTGKWLLSILVVLPFFIIFNVVLWSFVTQEREVLETMTWETKGNSNQYNREEVILSFKRSPRNFIGIFSDELNNYLRGQDIKTIDVKFIVTTDFGCVRGFREVQIGTLKNWARSGGYAGLNGDGPGIQLVNEPSWCE